MGEFLKKNSGNIGFCGLIGGYLVVVGTAIASIIRGDKRQVKYYKKQDEVQQEQLTYWKNLNNRKES